MIQFLIHKILTEGKDILGLHLPLQMTVGAQTSTKCSIKYFPVSLI